MAVLLAAQIAARPMVQGGAQAAQQKLGAAQQPLGAAQAAAQRAWLAGLEGAIHAVAKAMAVLWSWKTVHVASTARPLQLVSRADAAAAVQAATRAAAT